MQPVRPASRLVPVQIHVRVRCRTPRQTNAPPWQPGLADLFELESSSEEPCVVPASARLTSAQHPPRLSQHRPSANAQLLPPPALRPSWHGAPHGAPQRTALRPARLPGLQAALHGAPQRTAQGEKPLHSLQQEHSLHQKAPQQLSHQEESWVEALSSCGACLGHGSEADALSKSCRSPS